MALDFPGLFGDVALFPASFDDNQVSVLEGTRIIPRLKDDVDTIYTGTGFDSNGLGVSNNHTFQITAADLKNSKYLSVAISYKAHSENGALNHRWASLKIERQETGGGGGGWSDVLVFTYVVYSFNDGLAPNNADVLAVTTHFIELTDGEKKLGIDVKVSTSTGGGGLGGSNYILNIQTIFNIRN